jgi:hypothetical protein
MAYERDKDRSTRGVGAIAAVDRAAPGAQRRRQRAIMTATQRRDRLMAAVGMGMINDPSRPAGGPRRSPGTTSSGARIVRDHDGTPDPATVNLPPAAPPGTYPLPAPVTPPVVTPPVIAPPATTGTTAGTTVPIPVVVAQPGGSVGTTTGMQPTNPDWPSPVTLPDVPEATSAPDHTMRNVMLAGGAALAAYYLFFHKGAR